MPLSTQTHKPQTLHYLSNLRTCLTGLVILHHCSISYGGHGSWLYQESPPATSPALMTFAVVNQTFFMAGFFYISGFVSKTSIERLQKKRNEETGGEFVGNCRKSGMFAWWWNRFKRLGLPTITYSLIGPPIQQLVQAAATDRVLPSVATVQVTFRTHLSTLRGVQGVVWYPSLLLIFDTLSLIPLPNTIRHRIRSIPHLSTLQILTAVTITSFAARLKWGQARTTFLFISPGYLAQYIVYYILGRTATIPALALTVRERRILGEASKFSGSLAAALIIIDPSKISHVDGGLNLLALLYTILNESTGYLILSFLLDVFSNSKVLNRDWTILFPTPSISQVQKFFTSAHPTANWEVGEAVPQKLSKDDSKSLRELKDSIRRKGVTFNPGRYAYVAFLIHPIVGVGIQATFKDWVAGGVVKTCVLGSLVILDSVVLGGIIVHLLEILGCGGIL